VFLIRIFIILPSQGGIRTRPVEEYHAENTRKPSMKRGRWGA